MNRLHSPFSSKTQDSVASDSKIQATLPVWSCNEWDTLEEVIVGVVAGARVPDDHCSVQAVLPESSKSFFHDHSGGHFPKAYVEAAEAELEAFVHVLTQEGVQVRRPDRVDFGTPYATPHWSSSGGLYAAMPRDFLLVVGDEIIESPMAWRSRYHEHCAYRRLIKGYFSRGARWTAAPKPELRDALYDETRKESEFVINEFEPTFDAADFARLGRDLVVQRSEVTNHFGIEWLRRHLGDQFRIHVLEFEDDKPMHIDATAMPIGPGKLLVNPERVTEKNLRGLFKGWDILQAPQPAIPADHVLYMTSPWINMNTLMLDEHRMIVEASDGPMIRACHSWGIQPIPVPFKNFNRFGGSFHCATSDVRRRGTLESYLC